MPPIIVGGEDRPHRLATLYLRFRDGSEERHEVDLDSEIESDDGRRLIYRTVNGHALVLNRAAVARMLVAPSA